MLYCWEYAVRCKPDLGEDLLFIRSVWSSANCPLAHPRLRVPHCASIVHLSIESQLFVVRPTAVFESTVSGCPREPRSTSRRQPSRGGCSTDSDTSCVTRRPL